MPKSLAWRIFSVKAADSRREARAADLVLVDEGDLEAQLGRPEGGRVAARAGAEDDEVEVVGRADGHGQAVSERVRESPGRWASMRARKARRGGWIIAIDGTRGVPRGATEPHRRVRGR
jgi:hypothetical protein